MNWTELEKKGRKIEDLIKSKNSQIFSVFAVFITLSFVGITSGRFFGYIYVKGTVGHTGLSMVGYYIHIKGSDQSYDICNTGDFSDYMQDGMEVTFVGTASAECRGFLPSINLIYIEDASVAPPIPLILLKILAPFFILQIGMYGILIILYKLVMFKDKRLYLRSSKTYQ